MKNFNALVTKHFKLAAPDIAETLSAKDIPEWDSMNYLLFIADVEKEYGASFTMDEVLEAKTLGDILNMLRARSIQL